jgi:AraC-like DNA-binding protein
MAMVGSYGPPEAPHMSRTLPLQIHGVSFSKLFKHLFQTVDSIGANTEILNKFSMDDSFYRLCVGLLHPEAVFRPATENPAPFVRRELVGLCEFLRAHLNEPVSLSQMERMSGLSARVLQSSFQNSFGLSPKAWLKKQRLHAARAVLQKPSHKLKLTTLAYDFCFPSPSDFSRQYYLEFGELPSETLAKGRNAFSN